MIGEQLQRENDEKKKDYKNCEVLFIKIRKEEGKKHGKEKNLTKKLVGA